MDAFVDEEEREEQDQVALDAQAESAGASGGIPTNTLLRQLRDLSLAERKQVLVANREQVCAANPAQVRSFLREINERPAPGVNSPSAVAADLQHLRSAIASFQGLPPPQSSTEAVDSGSSSAAPASSSSLLSSSSSAAASASSSTLSSSSSAIAASMAAAAAVRVGAERKESKLEAGAPFGGLPFDEEAMFQRFVAMMDGRGARARPLSASAAAFSPASAPSVSAASSSSMPAAIMSALQALPSQASTAVPTPQTAARSAALGESLVAAAVSKVDSFFGSSWVAWCRAIDWRNEARSRNEVEILCESIDLLRQDNADVRGALDLLVRRAVAVQTAVETHTWAFAAAIQGRLSSTSLLSMEALPQLLSVSNNIARLGRASSSSRGRGQSSRPFRGRVAPTPMPSYSYTHSGAPSYPAAHSQSQSQSSSFRPRPSSGRGGGQRT